MFFSGLFDSNSLRSRDRHRNHCTGQLYYARILHIGIQKQADHSTLPLEILRFDYNGHVLKSPEPLLYDWAAAYRAEQVVFRKLIIAAHRAKGELAVWP